MPCELHLALEGRRCDENTVSVRNTSHVIQKIAGRRIPEVCLSAGDSLHSFVVGMLIRIVKDLE